MWWVLFLRKEGRGGVGGGREAFFFFFESLRMRGKAGPRGRTINLETGGTKPQRRGGSRFRTLDRSCPPRASPDPARRVKVSWERWVWPGRQIGAGSENVDNKHGERISWGHGGGSRSQ